MPAKTRLASSIWAAPRVSSGSNKLPVYDGKRFAAQVKAWEQFLNAPRARESLVSRWLYEHLFLAHLYFKGSEPGQFFQLLRSRTATGQPVDPIATRRPNEDLGGTFYYRLAPVQG